MKYKIARPAFLKKVLWVDFFAGFSIGLLGIIFYTPLAALLGLPPTFTFWVFVVNVAYALVAFRLASMSVTAIPLLLGLITANTIWTVISVGFIYLHFANATLLGQLFLVLNIVLVGGLAFVEGRQLERVPS